MSLAEDADGAFRQNLVDSGCSPEIVRQCMALAQKRNQAELIRVLSLHRRTLLDTLHQSEKRIDCLDYLVYMLEKQDKSKYRSGGI